tara:strand:+ start:2394 stop:3719 length:1326 start_codon:yes stop_codon:yes gene_type:complete
VNNIPEYTVTQLNKSIKDLLESNFEYIKLIGESGPITFASSGHLYFSIKENDEVISCICWKGSYENLDIKIEEGTEYNFYGRVTSYSKSGRSVYQLIINQIEYSGDGSILKLIERRKKDLSEKGFFDDSKKKSLPKYPQKIGVFTSNTGSVIHDIIHRIEDRFPMTEISIYPVSVQGKNSHKEIIEFLDLIGSDHKHKKPDLLIFARGGGSLEEMMPFNEPDLIEKVFNINIPSISAIGHETDYTLLDMVCDVRAPTPTAAAEIAVPEQNQILIHLNERKSDLIIFLKQKLMQPKQIIMEFNSSTGFFSKKIYFMEKKLFNSINHNIEKLISSLNIKKDNVYSSSLKIFESNPIKKILFFKDKLLSYSKNNNLFMKNKFKFLSQKTSLLNRLINSNSIDKNLKKGFAILKKDKKLIKDLKSLKKFDQFNIIMKDGSILIKK